MIADISNIFISLNVFDLFNSSYREKNDGYVADGKTNPPALPLEFSLVNGGATDGYAGGSIDEATGGYAEDVGTEDDSLPGDQ